MWTGESGIGEGKIMDKLQIAVLVEEHPYDVAGFQRMFNSFTDFDCFTQPLDLFVQDDENRSRYDAVLWYNIHWDEPLPDSRVRRYLETEAGRAGQGIVLLHHALLNYQDWDLWTEMCGLRHRGSGGLFKYTQGETVRQYIADPSHPVTREVSGFTVVDETYIIGEPEEPGNHILITTDNETSIKRLGWTRQFRESRVFCYASGHDNRVYGDGNFRRILRQGIRWAAGCDDAG
jgi:trehalose utilization protein